MAVDMETLAIAEVAEYHQLPMACVRVIIDPAHFNLPQVALKAKSLEGHLQLKELLWNFLRYPHEWPKLLQLSSFFRQTQHSLRLLTQFDLMPLTQ
jgi:adenosylhomocysteine nucleosidase